MQLAAFKLRLEGVPLRWCSRHEFKDWPFDEQTCVIFCRDKKEDVQEASTSYGVQVSAVLVSMRFGYVLSDGVERDLRDTGNKGMELTQAAMALRGLTMWFSSGGPGGGL